MKTVFLLVAGAGLVFEVSARGGPQRYTGTVASIGTVAAAETVQAVHPGGRGRPFWNAYSKWFLYAPAFDFKPVDGAVAYRFDARGADGLTISFVADSPTAALSSIWLDLPRGYVDVICKGVNTRGDACGESGTRRFWKKEPFRGGYPSAVRSYDAAADLAYDYLLGLPSLAYLRENGRPDPKYSLNGYPSKILSAEIKALVLIAERRKDRATDALLTARKAADHLIAGRLKTGTPLEHFTLTYEGEGEYGRSKANAGQNMLVYPAMAGSAFLSLYRAVKETKYLDAAEKIAATYLKLQGEDGTWPLKVYEKDVSPVGPNRLIPTPVIDFLEELFDVAGKTAYRQAADRAFAYVEGGPLKTYNWEAQFEDTNLSTPYSNPTKHEACSTAIYLLQRYPADSARLNQARELLRWAEDQFVWWNVPYGKNPRRESQSWDDWGGGEWILPGVQEQQGLWSPVDASAAKLIRTYLALYRAAGNPLDLAKARALGNSITRAQWDDGCIRTFWVKADRNDDRYHVWLNCHLDSAAALNELAAMTSAALPDSCLSGCEGEK